MKITFVTEDKERWEFNPQNGRLDHPCEFLTSWLRREDEEWVVLEWACWLPNGQEILKLVNHS